MSRPRYSVAPRWGSIKTGGRHRWPRGPAPPWPASPPTRAPGRPDRPPAGFNATAMTPQPPPLTLVTGRSVRGRVRRSVAVPFRGAGEAGWPGAPAVGAVAAGRDTAGAGKGAVEGVFGGVAEGSGDGADGVVGVAEAHGGQVHAPAGQVGGWGTADPGGETAGQGGAGDAGGGGQGGDGPVVAGLGVQGGEGGPGDRVGERAEPGGRAGVRRAGVEPGPQQLDEQDVHDAVEDRGCPRLGLAYFLGEQPERGVQGGAGPA